MKTLLVTLMCFTQVFVCAAANGKTDQTKLSSYLRHLVSKNDLRRGTRAESSGNVMTFVKTVSGKSDVLDQEGCKIHAKLGDIYIVEIPMDKIPALSLSSDVMRIEADRSCSPQLDSVAKTIDIEELHQGINIPQAYTGEGVVMGIMDVGFDLTNPTYYSRDLKKYRISRFWDMLSVEDNEKLAVGQEYLGRDAILNKKHSTDNLIISHGTHTSGIAAGSGYDSKYVGVAPESEICLVNNAVSDDSVYIKKNEEGLFTTATDALGFKYIFDYAESVSKPCVISFSEGSFQSFENENVLYYEALKELTGPGRIIVASAGNNGQMKIFMQKKPEVQRAGAFIYSIYNDALMCLNTDKDVKLVLKSYEVAKLPDSLVVSTAEVLKAPEGKMSFEFNTARALHYKVNVVSYPSVYNDDKVFDITVTSDVNIGTQIPFSVEVDGADATSELYTVNCIYTRNYIAPRLDDATRERTILAPGSAPDVICVGATTYREGFTNFQGKYQSFHNGRNGAVAPYSSVGPTYDNRIKPDVVAPGTNVISSYSSYYIEKNPEAFDVMSDVERYEFNGRTYSWNANTGTSMSTPVVGGIIALWLQANPNLTPDDIKNIFATTCYQKDAFRTYPNNLFGYGEINAYRGMLKVLELNNIEGLEEESEIYYLMPGEYGFDIKFDEALNENARLDIFTTDGRQVRSETICIGTDNYHVNISRGVYAVRVAYKGQYHSNLVRVR